MTRPSPIFTVSPCRCKLMCVMVVFGLVLTGAAGGAEVDEKVKSVVPLQAGDDAVSADFRLGVAEGTGAVTINLGDGAMHTFLVRCEPEKLRRRVQENGQSVWKEEALPDALVSFAGLVRYHSRPRIQRYTNAQQDDLAKRWDTLPAASQRFIAFEARQDERGVGIYLDGLYVGRRDAKGKLASLAFLLPKEAEVREPRSFVAYHNSRYLPLDMKSIAKPGVMRAATLSARPGLQTIEGIPLFVATGDQSVDVGVVRQMKGSWALEADEHLSRTALDGMPETAHFSVPQAYYTRVWALCAVDTDTRREPVITARLTRFANSGRGDAVSDTTLILPRGNEPLPPGVSKAGTVRYQKDGATVEAALLLVEFKLKPGDILDLLSMEKDATASMTASPYLDFEFLGKLGQVSNQFDARHKPDNQSTSAVHVFGVTLEKSPVELRLASGQPGNIFHNDEKPGMAATLTATRPGRVVFERRTHDVAGKVVSEAREQMSFIAAGESKRMMLSLNAGDLGWYSLDLAIRDEAGRELLTHSASFALLGPDTRQAGYESPYGTWWFAGAHYGAGDKDIAGPMLFKAGLRKTTFGWNKYSEKDMAAWKITQNQLGWGLAPRDKEHLAEAEKKIREELERFPHCTSADVFHESYRYYVPDELRDIKQADDEKEREAGKARAELAGFVSRFYREKFPQIKLLAGNSSDSSAITASLFRYGLDPKAVDYIGVEAVGQTCMPEKFWEGGTQGIWLAREAARRFGHELPVTGCFEFTARTDRNLGLQRQAEWIVRDMLLCHAYRFDHINPAILHDVGNAYFNTIYGAGGLCRRNPLLYPKPAYVGVATLTRVLDRVKLLGRVDTGSATVYALEFARADGRFVYALWTARGEAELRAAFAETAEVTRVGFYGQAEKMPVPTVTCGTAPIYIVSSTKARSIEISRRRFADPPASFVSANKMDNLGQWELAEADKSLASLESRSLPLRVAGDFDLVQAQDDERGACLQLTLNRKGKLPDIVSEYTAMRLKAPVAVAGTPAAIGLWVKGDSGWGKIIFEIEDAQGARWRTEGTYHDWPGDLSICHDGWCFMQFPLDGSSKEASPGNAWNSTSAKHGPGIEFPIKLTGLTVVMNRKALDLADMKDVKGVVRFRDLGVCR